MKSNSLRNNRKALAALLLYTGFIAGHPLSMMAGSNETSLEIVQQQIKVSGVVKDSMGEPVIGASVVEKGTSNGIITDINGNFSLSVTSGATLAISYIGYKTQEVQAVTGKVIDVTLKDDTEMLEEVVVVGFGTQKKVNLTGSVGIATAKELESRPVSSATQALQGLVPGLKITTSSGALDQNMDISVRGTGTIGSSSGSPLILIDGMEGDINTVNPQDIENISVLKDAAASSIYGSRAPFGVILITTKKGKAGKATINYNNSFRIASPIGLPESMDSYTFAVFMNESLKNSGKAARFSNETMQKMLDYQSGKLTAGMDPSPSNPAAWNDVWQYAYGNTDIYGELYKSTVFSQEHNVSVSGGSEKMTYYGSFNYLDQGGLLKIGEDGMKRYNATGKFTSELTDWLKFNFTARFTRNDVWRPRKFNDTFYRMFGRQNWPNIPMYDPSGNIFGYNAVELEQGGQRDVQTDRHYYQAALIFEPIKNWVTNVEFNYSIMNQKVKETTLPSYQLGPTGTELYREKDSGLYQEDKKENYLNLNVYSEYARTFNDSHNFKIMLGFQAEEMEQSDLNVFKNGLIMADMPEFDLTNGQLNSGLSKDATVHGYSNRWATAGFFGRLNYDYQGRYLAEANIRYDGTSRFRRGNRWQWSPSFSLGWNIAQEKFWQPIQNVANLLKLRFSYGQLGNQNTNQWYPTYRTMTLGILDGGWLQNGTKPNTAKVGDLISTVLTWEKVRTWDIGLDYGLFNNRLTGSFDYFIRYTKDMVGDAPELPLTLGVKAPQTNNCDLKTKGWEVSLAWRDRLKNGLNYGVSVSLSDQQTYIDSYPSNKTGSLTSGSSNTGIKWSYIAGQKINQIWGFETIGIAKTQAEMDAHIASLPNGEQSAIGTQWGAGDIMYKDLNGDGKISTGANTLNDHGDLKVLGDANPHYFFGIDLTADWKGFDFRCFLQGVLKHDFWAGGDSTTNNDNAGGYFWGARGNVSEWHIRGFVQHNDYFRAESVGLEGYEIPANVDSYFPRPLLSYADGGKNQRVQSRYMQNAAYMRLKNLQLGYTLPATWTKKAGISKCRLFVSGENLLTFTSLFDVFDPETCTGGVGGNVYPLSSTWSFGLSLTF
ncbi:SusC/RagA family TonB-linked outer membrane protein [Bacteroides cellulosilyticus]|jgi:TonB-linked SusC/RagA family outer membrane protein|uniref:SusC/RagA family TonB-linked outer membrane protein n=1 Tax=Bacteroides cellulosilyticus TaxID=246787 RepID=UPI00189BDDEB|nr:TonB-dependent receptor [Bacteroides cellulosilyticus]